MTFYIVALLVFLLLIFASRFIQEKAMAKLSQEQKAGLISLFSKDRIIQFGGIIVTVLIFFGLVSLGWIEKEVGFYGYVGLTILLQLVFTLWSIHKLKKNAYPAGFIQSYTVSGIIRFVGVTVMIAAIITM